MLFSSFIISKMSCAFKRNMLNRVRYTGKVEFGEDLREVFVVGDPSLPDQPTLVCTSFRLVHQKTHHYPTSQPSYVQVSDLYTKKPIIE